MQITYDECWSLIEYLIDAWWRPLEKNDGISRDELVLAEKNLGRTLPAALYRWYLMAGRRTDLINFQDHLLYPTELKLRNNVLEFCIENQGVIYWGIKASELANSDPPVIATEKDYDMDVEEVGTFSFFILNMLAWASSLFRATSFWSKGEQTQNTKRTVGNFFVYAGFAHAYPPNKSQLFCSRKGIIWLWESHIDFFARNEDDLKEGLNLIDALWQKIL